MHDNLLDRENQSHAAAEYLDQRIIRVLEAAPTPHIPADFAARIARQLPAKRPESLTPTHYGQRAVLIATFATLAALLILALYSADHVTGHLTFGLVESLLFAQFIALAVWLSVWRHSLR